jgi:hypothetical protein
MILRASGEILRRRAMVMVMMMDDQGEKKQGTSEQEGYGHVPARGACSTATDGE